MKNYILANIKQQVLQLDKAHAVVHHHTATSSKISDNIRALWRAIMDVERAMEIDDQMEPYAESYSDSLVYESDNLILL